MRSAVVKRPKHPTLLQQAQTACAAIENVLDAEQGVVDRADARNLVDLSRSLALRVAKAEAIIDGVALNRARAGGLDAALRALYADSETRFPKWRKRKAG